MKRIEILVQPKGTVQLQTHGFAGSPCLNASRFIEAALGTRTAEQLTAEYHEQVLDHQRNSVEQ